MSTLQPLFAFAFACCLVPTQSPTFSIDLNTLVGQQDVSIFQWMLHQPSTQMEPNSWISRDPWADDMLTHTLNSHHMLQILSYQAQHLNQLNTTWHHSKISPHNLWWSQIFSQYCCVVQVEGRSLFQQWNIQFKIFVLTWQQTLWFHPWLFANGYSHSWVFYFHPPKERVGRSGFCGVYYLHFFNWRAHHGDAYFPSQ